VAHSGRANTGVGQFVVQPGGGAAAQVGADSLVERRKHLEQHEHHPDQSQGRGQRLATPDRAHEHAHGDGEHRRERAAQQEHGPPRDRQRGIGLREDGEELPLGACPETLDQRGSFRLIVDLWGPERD
jgi:hypothetical protein